VKPICLEARALTLGFPPVPPVIQGLDLRLGEGELAVLAGRNGSGKTILAKCLAGLFAPSSGRVLFEGRILGSFPGSPATRVAYLFQDARLQVLGDSVLDDVLFGLSAIGAPDEEAPGRAEEALRLVGLAEKGSWLPSRLSGGELRRLAIASVLALDPRVLILDEPFANLDWAGIDSVLRVLLGLRARGTALLVLTHELDKILGAADRLLVLDRGLLVADGDPRAILAAGIEDWGLRDPLRHVSSIQDLFWIGAPEPRR